MTIPTNNSRALIPRHVGTRSLATIANAPHFRVTCEPPPRSKVLKKTVDTTHTTARAPRDAVMRPAPPRVVGIDTDESRGVRVALFAPLARRGDVERGVRGVGLPRRLHCGRLRAPARAHVRRSHGGRVRVVLRGVGVGIGVRDGVCVGARADVQVKIDWLSGNPNLSGRPDTEFTRKRVRHRHGVQTRRAARVTHVCTR